MPITTNNLISRQTVGSAGAASITFSNIPQTFTDLRIVMSSRNSNDSVSTSLIFNGDTAANYSFTRIIGYGSGAVGADNTTGAANISFFGSEASSFTASVFSSAEIYLPNYRSSVTKVVSIDTVTENNAVAGYQNLASGLWSGTAAVTSITLTSTLLFDQYSTFSLYGISSSTSTQNTSVPYATGGDVIATDGSYWYHSFKYSGTFTPLKALTADYLVVAGGGAAGATTGGGWGGGGGGAGGYRTAASQSFVLATNYAIVVGAGGVGASGSGSYGGKGGNSSLIGGAISTTSTGGGGGGTTGTNGQSKIAGQQGGSGGGSAQDTTSNSGGSGNQGGYSPVEGYAGGNANGGSPYQPSQGGGATAVGGSQNADDNPTTNYATSSISGSSVNYSAGGYAKSTGTNFAADANTGNGGHSRRTGDGAGGNGGSGIIIVRYAV